MPLAAKKGHNGRKTWAKRWGRMSITIPNWAIAIMCAIHGPPRSKKLNSRVWTTCGDRRMPWMKAGMCCAAFLRRVGCSETEMWRTTGWFDSGLPLGCGNFGSQTPRAAFPARLVRTSFLTLPLDASTLDTIQNDRSSVVNSLCAGSTCYLLYTLVSL